MSEKEDKMRAEYMPKIRERILRDLEDLKTKIESNEDFPHGEQDVDSLVQISDNIESCLSAWYY